MAAAEIIAARVLAAEIMAARVLAAEIIVAGDSGGWY